MPKVARPLIVALFVAWTGFALAQSPLRMAITQDEGTLTPYTYQTGYPGYELMTLIYDQLFLMDVDLVPQPWLAASLHVADELTYHLELREGVLWHDGTAFTAEDVAFTVGYYKTYARGRFTTSANKVAEVEVTGPLAVTFTLAAPDATFVQTGLADMPMLPKHVWESVEEPLVMATAMGTGPYRLAEYVTDQYYRLEANTDFWGPAPAHAEIVAVVIRDETATFQALQANQIDVAVRPVPAGSVERFESERELAVQRGAGFPSTLLIMDVEQPGLADVAVRRAIAGAIDYQRLIDVLLLGYGTAGTPGFLHPASRFANPATAEYPRLDAAAVAEQLEGAGYARGNDGVFVNVDGTRLAFEFLAPANNPVRLRAAELIALDLNAVGIGVTVRSIENEALVQRAWPDFNVAGGRDYQMSMFGWSAPVNAQANLRGLLHSDPTKGTLNLSGYVDAETDRLVDEAAVTTDDGARRALLFQVQERLASDLPFVTLFYQDGIYAYRPAAFDGWSYMAGQGIIHKGSFVRP